MLRFFRIAFCILSCLCVAGSFVVGARIGWEWFALVFAVAILFGAGMLGMKALEDKRQPKTQSDFMQSQEELPQPIVRPLEDDEKEEK